MNESLVFGPIFYSYPPCTPSPLTPHPCMPLMLLQLFSSSAGSQTSKPAKNEVGIFENERMEEEHRWLCGFMNELNLASEGGAH